MFPEGKAGPSARTPYRLNATPDRPTFRLTSPSPARSTQPYSPDDYLPESPTRGPRRSPTPTQSRTRPPPPFPLTSAKGKWRPPRLWRSTRRALLALLTLAVIVLVGRSKLGVLPQGEGLRKLRARFTGEDAQDGLCRFVSPVEAYRRDLERLRKLYPHAISRKLVESVHHDLPHPSNIINHTHHAHTFSPTGHLLVSPDPTAPHPIPLLLSLGEGRWEDLLSRQSNTLGEAVVEYKRRYGRNPPRGFDIWWDFAMAHEMVLPDEYDRINLDLAPFFALPKQEMRRRMEMVEEMKETFTLVVQNGRVDIQILDAGGLQWDGTIPRAKDAASLLDVFSRFLPDMKATFSIFDQPQIYLSWARRESLVEMGLRGEHTTHLQETDSSHVRLSRSCPPESNLRKNGTTYQGRSFIYDNLEAGDLCQNPDVVPLHGLTLEPHGHDSHPRPHTQLLPLFSLAKTSINSDILVTPLDQFHDQPGEDPKWEDKTSSKLVWRGSSTGMSMMTRDLDWRSTHRIRLHHFANNRSSEPAEFLVPDLGQRESKAKDVKRNQDTPLNSQIDEESAADVADFFYDMQLSGAPLQCSEEDGTCSDMWQEIEFAGFQPSTELNKHKFLLDIDGNGWSGRFRRLMSTNSVVIKASLFTEWFQPHLIPWFMYVPAKLDFSDLTDILAFFRGSPKHPDLAFDETAKALARNGQCFAQRMFRLEDLQAYMMRLFLEYARLVADEGEDMDYHHEDEYESGGDEATVELEEDISPVPDFLSGSTLDKETSAEDLGTDLVDDPSELETPLDPPIEPEQELDLESTESGHKEELNDNERFIDLQVDHAAQLAWGFIDDQEVPTEDGFAEAAEPHVWEVNHSEQGLLRRDGVNDLET